MNIIKYLFLYHSGITVITTELNYLLLRDFFLISWCFWSIEVIFRSRDLVIVYSVGKSIFDSIRNYIDFWAY